MTTISLHYVKNSSVILLRLFSFIFLSFFQKRFEVADFTTIRNLSYYLVLSLSYPLTPFSHTDFLLFLDSAMHQTVPLPQKLCICPFLCMEYFSSHFRLLVRCHLFREVIQAFPGLLYKIVTSLSLRLLPQPASFLTVAINTQFFHLFTCFHLYHST